MSDGAHDGPEVFQRQKERIKHLETVIDEMSKEIAFHRETNTSTTFTASDIKRAYGLKGETK